MQVNTCQDDIDVAYWWVIILVGFNFLSSTFTYILNRLGYCKALDMIVDARDDPEYNQNFDDSRIAVYFIITISSWVLLLLWVLLPFCSIPLLSAIISCFNQKTETQEAINLQSKSTA
jgi:hypothetical protein